MEYTELSTEEQVQILGQRKKQYEAEHFNHTVNKDLLIATGATDEETKRAIADADKALKTLDHAHAETVKKLNALKPPTPAKKGAKSS